MSDASSEERTEEATPRKLEEAFQEGRIPRSPELTTAVLLLGGGWILKSLGPTLASSVTGIATYGLMVASSSSLDSEGAVAMVRAVGWKLFAATSTVMLALSGVALAISALQARGVMTLKTLEPKWERLDPVTNFKQMAGLRPWMELLKSLLKLGVIGAAVYASLGSAWSDTMALAQQAPRQLVAVIHDYSVRLVLTCGVAYLGLAALDYFYQLWSHGKSLRMSKQEVKEEHKQSEGDPMVKAQRRAMGRALARRQMLQEVPTADVVVTNPTHIAVALKYDPTRADAPMVLAMGQRKVAQRIKEIARESGVPTVENRPLARALLAGAKVGQMIPPELYVAVAEVLAFVFSQRRAERRLQHSGVA